MPYVNKNSITIISIVESMKIGTKCPMYAYIIIEFHHFLFNPIFFFLNFESNIHKH